MDNTNHIGLSFWALNAYTDHLAQILEGIPVEDYTWHVSCSENLVSPVTRDHWCFLPDGVYSGTEFADLIRTPKYYLYLLQLIAVPNGVACDVEGIKNSSDFAKSTAEIALSCADRLIDLYAKGEKLDLLVKACEKYCSADPTSEGIQLFTKETEERYGFGV